MDKLSRTGAASPSNLTRGKLVLPYVSLICVKALHGMAAHESY